MGQTREQFLKQAEDDLRKAGFEPLEPYPGSTTKPWKSRCTICGQESSPHLRKVRQGSGCVSCEMSRKDAERAAHLHTFYVGPGRKSAIRRWIDTIPVRSDEWHGVPTERAEEELRAAGFEPLEPWPQSVDIPWRCRCTVCGNETTKRLTGIRQGTGCRHCAPNARVAPGQAEADIRSAGFEPLEPYPGHSRAAWRCLCTACGTEVTPRVEFVRRGTGCPVCAATRRGAASRLPSEEAVADARAAGYEPLEPYPGSKVPWRCRCAACGRESSPRLGTIRQGSRCRFCSFGQPVDPEAEMRAAGFEPLEEFPGTKKPWRSRCVTCRNESAPHLSSIRKGSGCKFCNAGRPADPEAEMRAAGFEPLEPYPGNAHNQWRCRCIKCGEETSPLLHSVRRGTGCRFCARRMSSDEAVGIMRAAGFEVLEPYGGSKKPWRSRCTVCGEESSPHLSSVRKGSGCRFCARRRRSTDSHSPEK